MYIASCANRHDSLKPRSSPYSLSQFPLHAEDKPLPEAPKPKDADRIWAVESATLGALYTTDFTLTARGLGDSDSGMPGFVRGESARYLVATHPTRELT